MADTTNKPRMALSSAIASQLKTITNADGENWFDNDTVREYPTFSFTGYPTAIIVPSNVDPDFQTSLDNNRFYMFLIVLVEQAQEKNLGDAYKDMRQLEDDVLDLFDDDYSLSSVQNNLASKYTIIDTKAAPSAWERATVETLQLLTATIRLQVHISIDIS